jgi:hypothetical protein
VFEQIESLLTFYIAGFLFCGFFVLLIFLFRGFFLYLLDKSSLLFNIVHMTAGRIPLEGYTGKYSAVTARLLLPT